MANPVAIPRPVRRWLRVSITSWPRPPAPSKVASTTMPSAIMIDCAIPVRIVGIAIGSCTLRSVCIGLPPNIFDASTACGDTSWMPSVVSRTTGGNANTTVADVGHRADRQTGAIGTKYTGAGTVYLVEERTQHLLGAPVERCQHAERNPDQRTQHHRDRHQRQRLDRHLPQVEHSRVQQRQSGSRCRPPLPRPRDQHEDDDREDEPRHPEQRRLDAVEAPAHEVGDRIEDVREQPVVTAIALRPSCELVERVRGRRVESDRHDGRRNATCSATKPPTSTAHGSHRRSTVTADCVGTVTMLMTPSRPA